MTSSTVVVTGATGFIGGHAARALHAARHHVRAVGRDPQALQALRRDGLQVQRVDLAHDALDPLLAGCDAVVHAAALAAPWGPREAFIAANVTATERVMAAAKRAGVPRVVHLSSPSIYFRLTDQYNLTEAVVPPRRWITHYAQTKWESEQCVHALCAGSAMTAAILRPRAVFGVGDRAIFPRLIAAAQRGRLPLIDGGRALIDATHVDNVVQAITLALHAPLPSQVCAFNITNGEPTTVQALFAQLFAALDMPVRYLRLPRSVAMPLAHAIETAARLRPGQPEPLLSRYTLGVLAYAQTLDIRAAQRVLGYAPQVSLTDGIARFAQAWRQQDR